MAGDRLDIGVNYYFRDITSVPPSGDIVQGVSSLLVNLLGGATSTSNGHSFTSPTSFFGSSSYLGMRDYLQSGQQYNTAKPKAYINYLFFDENLNYVPYDIATGMGSYSKQVTDAGNHMQPLVADNITVPKNGYALVYVSNESTQQAVYFDNLAVTHTRRKILEETHYYAYGLKITAISGQAFQKPSVADKFQGEYSDFEEETGWNDFELRSYDPQIGRWLQNDPYDEFESGYIGMANDPVNNVDPDGGSIFGSLGNDMLFGAAVGAMGGIAYNLLTKKDNWNNVAIGAGLGLGASFIVGGGLNFKGSVDLAKDVTPKTLYQLNLIVLHGSTTYDGAAGGKLGGHVMINFNTKVVGSGGFPDIDFNDDETYGFTGWGGKDKNNDMEIGRNEYKEVPILPSVIPGTNIWNSQIHKSDHYGSFSLIKSGLRMEHGVSSSLGIATIFTINVDKEKFDLLKGWYEKYANTSGTTPYPYTFLGKKCTSSLYGELKKVGVVKNTSIINSFINAMNPGALYKYLQRLKLPNMQVQNLNGLNIKDFNLYGK